MDFKEFEKPEGVSPNEVGLIIFGDERGLLIVSDDDQVPPLDVTGIPEEIRDEYSFTLTVNPQLAFFLGALQSEAKGEHVPKETLIAGRLLWWLTIENAKQKVEAL